MPSLMLSEIIFRFSSSYRLYSLFSCPKSFTSICPLTESVSLRMPFILSLHSCDSRVSDHLVFPALRVGIANRGTITRPIVARSQFFWYIAARATISVITLERMLENVLVIVIFTPSMSLVILVTMSP